MLIRISSEKEIITKMVSICGTEAYKGKDVKRGLNLNVKTTIEPAVRRR